MNSVSKFYSFKSNRFRVFRCFALSSSSYVVNIFLPATCTRSTVVSYSINKDRSFFINTQDHYLSSIRLLQHYSAIVCSLTNSADRFFSSELAQSISETYLSNMKYTFSNYPSKSYSYVWPVAFISPFQKMCRRSSISSSEHLAQPMHRKYWKT